METRDERVEKLEGRVQEVLEENSRLIRALDALATERAKGGGLTVALVVLGDVARALAERNRLREQVRAYEKTTKAASQVLQQDLQAVAERDAIITELRRARVGDVDRLGRLMGERDRLKAALYMLWRAIIKAHVEKGQRDLSYIDPTINSAIENAVEALGAEGHEQPSMVQELEHLRAQVQAQAERIKRLVSQAIQQARGLEVRPPLRQFVVRMEETLQQRDAEYGPRGWREASPQYLLSRLLGEVAELAEAMAQGAGMLPTVYEAVDVANLAMMIADRVGGPWEDCAK